MTYDTAKRKQHLRELQKQLMQFVETLYEAVSQMNDL